MADYKRKVFDSEEVKAAIRRCDSDILELEEEGGWLKVVGGECRSCVVKENDTGDFYLVQDYRSGEGHYDSCTWSGDKDLIQVKSVRKWESIIENKENK